MGAGTPGVWGTSGTAAPPPAPLSRRARRGWGAVLVAAVVGLAAVGVWTAVDPQRYGGSGAGCVTLTVPSTTGGAVVHACGDRALALCRSTGPAGSTPDRLAVLIREQCGVAGLAVADGP